MNNLIVENWNSNERKLPDINCIVYPDGNVTVLSYYHVHNPNTSENTGFCNPLCDTTIDSIVKYDNDIWVSVSEWVSIDYKSGKIYGGDGTMGNEGFVACVD